MTTASVLSGQTESRRQSHSHPAGGVILSVNPRSLGRGFSFAQFSGQVWFSYYFGGFTCASRGESER